jgi:hypothetical protein
MTCVIKGLVSILIFLFICSNINAQSVVDVDWAFTFSPRLRAGEKKLVTDQKGNLFSLCNFHPSQGDKIEKQVLSLDYCRSVGIIIKLNPKGKLDWHRLIKPECKNGINNSGVFLVDIATTSEGDIIVIGGSTGRTYFPSIQDTISKNGNEGSNDDFRKYFMLKYSSKGELMWYKDVSNINQFDQVLCNEKDEIYLKTGYRRSFKFDNKVIDPISDEYTGSEIKIKAIFKFNKDGEFITIQNRWNQAKGNNTLLELTRIEQLDILLDKKDNLVIYGQYSGTLKLSEKVTLKCNVPHYDYKAGFIGKYDKRNKLLWQKKLGGRWGGARMVKPAFNSKNDIYMAGTYTEECIFSDGINVVNKSKPAPAQTNPKCFFYAKLTENGGLSFIKHHSFKRAYNYCRISSICIDTNGYTHMFGVYNDSLQFSKETSLIFPGSHTYTIGRSATEHTRNNVGFYYAVWFEDSIVHLQDLVKGWGACSLANNSYVIGNDIVFGGEYNTKTELIGRKRNTVLNNTHTFNGMLVCKIKNAFKDEPQRENDSVIDYLSSVNELLDCSVMNADTTYSSIWTSYGISEETEVILQQPIVDNWYQEELNCGIDLDSVAVKAYPNPFIEHLNMEGFGLKGEVQIVLLSDLGKLIYTQMLMCDGGFLYTMDLSQLSAGKYYVLITQNGFKKAIPVVKMN